MSESAYCAHGVIGPCQECYEAEIAQERGRADFNSETAERFAARAAQLEAALRGIRPAAATVGWARAVIEAESALYPRVDEEGASCGSCDDPCLGSCVPK